MTNNSEKSLESEINSIIDWPIMQLTRENIDSFEKYEEIFNKCLSVLTETKDSWGKLGERKKSKFLEEFKELEPKLRRIFDYYISAFRIRKRRILAKELLNSYEQTKLERWVENRILTSNKFQAIYFEKSEEVIDISGNTKIQQNMPGVLYIKGIAKKKTFYKLVSYYVYQILLEALVSYPNTRECSVSAYFFKKIIGGGLRVKFNESANLASALTGIFFETVKTDGFSRSRKDDGFRVTLIKGIENELQALRIPTLTASSKYLIVKYLEPAATENISLIDFFAEELRKTP